MSGVPCKLHGCAYCPIYLAEIKNCIREYVCFFILIVLYFVSFYRKYLSVNSVRVRPGMIMNTFHAVPSADCKVPFADVAI